MSRRLGYRPDGVFRRVVRSAPVVEQRMRLSRAEWVSRQAVDVAVEGLAPALPLFGVEGHARDAASASSAERTSDR
ncbi:hypothetical protein SAXI111661_12010 [Saccharomonospora xinjiangensis]|uniref:hypothetical protein n=1 Tax=Saccharomonospora xinjiangensis TaxID=75294 RepID=UPI00106FBB8D|nr:hypothetical protein [Saccharomonospora xinjiangensis]QBQ58628.1 hypothetical protein EYD13_01205 [Saccharomonospora xinjiangensis]